MREIRFSTGRLGSDINAMENGGGYVNVAVSRWGQLADGTYGNKTMWVTVYLNEAQKKAAEEKGIKKGTAVNIVGNFDYGMVTSQKDGKQYLSITCNPYRISKAPGGLGGITTANIDNVRLTEDITVNENGNGYVRAAFDTFVQGKTETRWVTLMLNESMLKKAQGLKLKKGSHIDLIGEINIEQNTYNGKDYINATIVVGCLAYAANAGRQNDGKTASATTPASAPTSTPAPAVTPATTAPTAPVATAPTAPVATEVADDFGSSSVGDASDPFDW